MSLRALALGLAMIALGVSAAEEHGKTDVYARDDVRLAWAVAQGPDEARTFIVIRVAFDAGSTRAFTATGRDPFTNAERAWSITTLAPGRAEVRIPRGAFVEFPRTELRFLAGDPGENPRLEVVYHGAPDTTPEFNDPGKLEAYLDSRLANAKGKQP